MKEPRRKLEFDMDFSEKAMMAAVGRTPTPPEPLPPTLEVERQQMGARIAKDVYKLLKMKSVVDEVLVQDIVERAIRLTRRFRAAQH